MLRQFTLSQIKFPGLAAWLIVFGAFLLEIFLYNGHFWIIPGQQTLRTVSVADMALVGLAPFRNDPTLLQPDANVEHSIEILNLNQPVRTLWLDVTEQKRSVIKCQVWATDAASSSYYKVIEDHRLISQDEGSRYIRLHLDGASGKVKISFELMAGQDLRLPGLVVNKRIPLAFSLIRFGLLTVLGLLVLFLRRAPVCQEPRCRGDSMQRVLLILTGLAVILAGLVIAAAAAGGKMTNLQAVNGDIYSRDLTQALASGQLHLLVEPPSALAGLYNPYDPALRASAGIRGVLWDVAYYQGHYYVYFGIVPALLLFLPFHLLTGLFLPSVWAVIVFSILGMIFLLLLLDRILIHFFPGLPFRFHLTACLTMAAGCNLWWCLSRPKFYEVAITGGLFCGVLGLYLLFRCWQDRQDGRLKPFRLAAGCFWLALAVGARPNLLLLSLLPLPLFWQLLRRPIPAPDDRPVPARSPAVWLARSRNLLLIGLPYLVIGGGLMLYNQLRFGQIGEFGASYQLTVTDMGARGMLAPARILPGLWYALFNFPAVNTRFPFLHFQTIRPFDYSGYFYSDNHCAGLLVTLPACWILAAWPWLRRPVLRHTGREFRCLLASLAGLGFLMVCLDSMAAGSAGRYLTDFAWLWVLAAILLAAALLARVQDRQLRQIILSVFGLLAGLTAPIALLLALQGENDLILSNNPRIYYQLERLLAFWLP